MEIENMLDVVLGILYNFADVIIALFSRKRNTGPAENAATTDEDEPKLIDK